MNNVNKDSDEYIYQNTKKTDYTDLQSQLLLRFYSLEHGRFLIDDTKIDEISKYLYGVALAGVKAFCDFVNEQHLPRTNRISSKFDDEGVLMCMRIIKTYDTKKSIKFFKEEYKELAYDIKYVVDEKLLTNIINGVS